jgi:hypothetical protein
MSNSTIADPIGAMHKSWEPTAIVHVVMAARLKKSVGIGFYCRQLSFMRDDYERQRIGDATVPTTVPQRAPTGREGRREWVKTEYLLEFVA